MNKEYIFDAKGKKMGRLATEVARVLMGKTSPNYRANVVAPVSVIINNTEDLDMNEKRIESLTYKKYSGYPGGLKTTTGKNMLAKKGKKEMLKIAISGMLPHNKLKAQMLKKLTII